MRRTLRRSCTACAKAKNKCDLRTPRCSRCAQRQLSCTYTNEPLNAHISRKSTASSGLRSVPPSNSMSVAIGSNAFDPFDSYPATSLPRSRVQSLIFHFLSKIAFQYYPLDLNASSNPFINSWWPVALADPALFNVSLQTASLDTELLAQKGFRQSEILMRDAVSLVRHKIDDPILAFQDATMDAVVTLAAIEHGKGNFHECRMHVDAVKRMVAVRGGISAVKRSSPLTARMVPWVSMLVTGSPQFEVQDDFGNGDGIAPIGLWQSALQELSDPSLPDLQDLGVDSPTKDIVVRLRLIFTPTPSFKAASGLSTNDLHDLTCFVLHKLLQPGQAQLNPMSECLRYAVAIYMFIIHGPTYYSHAAMLHHIALQLQRHLQILPPLYFNNTLHIWCLSVGISASIGTVEHDWYIGQAMIVSGTLRGWIEVEGRLKNVFSLDTRTREMFRGIWEPIFNPTTSFQRGHISDDPSMGFENLLN